MRTNKLIWIGLGVVIIFTLIVVINKNNEPVEQQQAKETGNVQQKVTPVAIEGDTIVETMKQTNARYEASQSRVKELETEGVLLNERLAALEMRAGTSKGDDRLDKVLNRFSSMTDDIESLSSQFMNQQQQFETTAANGYEFSNGDLGWDDKNGSTRKSSGYGKKKDEKPSFRRLEGYATVPVISHTAQPSIGFETPVKGINDNDEDGLSGLALDSKVRVDTITPHFTIPARSTLLDAVAMTAMIGRVPIGDKLKDPFPVKIIVGNKNLATNGLRIPGLDGIVFEGIATGNWNLSCTSVALTAATFTFKDGRVQHLESNGAKSAIGSLNPIGESKNKSSIGYISNKLGVPCIPGERVTDAPRQLAAVGVMGLAGSYFNAKALSEVTTKNNISGGDSSAVTGDVGKFELNKTLSDTVGTVNDFYMSRNRDTFDAIVVQPGVDVVLHITSDLLIDYHTSARKLVYSMNTGGSHEKFLD